MIYSHNLLICWNELTPNYTRHRDLALDGALSQRFVITTFKLKILFQHIFEIILVENYLFLSFSDDNFEENTDFIRMNHIRELNDSVTHSAYFQ